MILSSANILEILQGSAVIRLAAGEIRIVEKKPIASGREGFYVYIEKYPTLEEFEAVWRIWIESDGSEPDDLLLAEMRRLLPNFEFKLGLVIEATVRDFKSDRTEVRPKPSQAPAVMPPSGWMSGIEKRFEELVEDIQDRMLLVNSGKPGKDGQRGPEGRPGARGRDGRNGRDGKDLLATSGETDATLVTELHVSKTNSANNDVELLLDAILPITNQIYISDNEDPSQAHLYDLVSYTETTDGFSLVVTHVETPGPEPSLNNNDQYDFLFLTGAGSGGASSIDELTDVDTSTTAPFVGQTLVWDGTNWVPGDSSEGIGEAPIDGDYYVRSNGQWVTLVEALTHLNIGDGGQFSPFGDGGNFTTGYAGTAYSGMVDGSDLTDDTTDAVDDEALDGGYWS
jgi:hypothetical protein